MKLLFLGGPGNISESAISYFLDNGDTVAVIKRTKGGLMGFEGKIAVYYGDRDRLDVLLPVFSEFQPDIVIDCTCFEIKQAETVLRALYTVPCRRLIFISTADVYGYPLTNLPMHEDDPWNKPNGKYAEDKKAIEALYQRAFWNRRPALTIVRPGYSLGKTFALTSFERNRGQHLITRIRQGKPVYSPGDGTTLIDAGAAFNTGRMLARICENENTIGQAYNCANDHAVTYDDYLQAFASALGKTVHIVHIPTDFMFSLGRQEVADSILGDLARFNLYFSVDKFRTEFPDFKWTYSLTDAVRDFMEYQESVGGFEGAEERMFEDKVVDLWLQSMAGVKAYISQNIN